MNLSRPGVFGGVAAYVSGKGEGMDECVRETKISSPPPTFRPHNIKEFLGGAAF